MVPIYETDIAKKRWETAEWNNFELWERIERREKKKKWIWIFCTFLFIVFLFAIPVFIDQKPKWKTRALSRKLAQTIQFIKKEAAIKHTPLQLVFNNPPSFHFQIRQVPHCSNPSSSIVVQEANLETEDHQYQLISKPEGIDLNIPGLSLDYCYDPMSQKNIEENLLGFGIALKSDMQTKRTDRITILLYSDKFGEISFD